MSVPVEHVEDSKKLEGADGRVRLYELTLNDGSTIFHLKAKDSVTWQGDDYEGTALIFDKVSRNADDKVSRPKLSLINPNGVYSFYVDQGLLEGATLIRHTVLREHIDNDINISIRNKWKVSRVSGLNERYLVLELRNVIDGHDFISPGRMFIPPEFKQVSLN